MNPKTRKIIRSIARIWSGLMVAFMLFMFIAHIIEDGIGPVIDFSVRDALMMISMICSVIGLGLAWKWERLGGWMTVGGMLAFYLFDYIFSGDFPRGPVFLIIAFPGILFLILTYTVNLEDQS